MSEAEAVRAFAVYSLFFLSGISGLVYQVVWVRQFGNVFGNTIHSAALVSGVFLCGLGVGSTLVGGWSDRRWCRDGAAPLRAYGAFELGIGVLGLAVAALLPLLEPFSAAISSYGDAGPGGWRELTGASHLLRAATALVLLAPITLLMGGTLTLLIRHLVASEVGAAGWRIGALYGTNTAGAALGAFLTDFALIPRLGVFATEAVAVVLNVCAGCGALALARGGAAAVAAPRAAPPSAPVPPDAAAARRATSTGAALFCAGFTALGLQIVWLRYLTGVVGSYRAVFSLLLTVILVGIWLGSLLGGFLHRRLGRAALLYLGVQVLLVVSALATLAGIGALDFAHTPPALAERHAAAGAAGRAWIETWLNLRPIGLLVFAPALCMGFAYPLANAHVQRLEASVGRRAGALYLWNTLGNVAGSLVTGFALLPLLGIQNSVGVLVGVAGLGLAAFHRACAGDAPTRTPLRPAFAAAAAALALALGAWSLLPPGRLLAPSVPRDFAPGQEVLAVREGVQETLAVIEVPGVERRLFTNGHSMSSTHRFAQRYMRLFAHVPLLAMEAPRRVLVICFGVGNTLHAASLHPTVERLEAVDLSRDVVEHAHWFAHANGGIVADPRVSIHVNDGRQHLRMQPPASYDLVTLEPPPISYAGVASLYAREFYALAKSRLREGGALTQWLPAYQVPERHVLALIRAFVDVFPNAVLLSGYHNELLLLGWNGGDGTLDMDAVRTHWKQRRAVREDLKRIDVETLSALFGTFVADAETLERATQGVPPLTDDRPVTEYGVRARLFETRLPESIFAVERVDRWCPTCFRPDGAPRTAVRHLPGHLAALGSYYASERFLRHASHESAAFRHAAELPDDPAALAAARASRYLRSFLAPPDRMAKRAD